MFDFSRKARKDAKPLNIHSLRAWRALVEKLKKIFIILSHGQCFNITAMLADSRKLGLGFCHAFRALNVTPLRERSAAIAQAWRSEEQDTRERLPRPVLNR
jgi:hypothetical protein